MYLHFIPINNHFKIRNNNVSHLSFDSPTSLIFSFHFLCTYIQISYVNINDITQLYIKFKIYGGSPCFADDYVTLLLLLLFLQKELMTLAGKNDRNIYKIWCVYLWLVQYLKECYCSTQQNLLFEHSTHKGENGRRVFSGGDGDGLAFTSFPTTALYTHPTTSSLNTYTCKYYIHAICNSYILGIHVIPQ